MDKIKTRIDGLEIYPLKKIETDKGKLFHVLRNDNEFFEKFGEAYVSMTNPSVIKGWKYHKLIRQNFTVPVGAVKFVFFDDRKESTTKGNLEEIIIGENQYNLIKVPEEIWYSFQTISNGPSYIFNCTTLPHVPDESMTKDLNTMDIPYKWS